MNDALVEQKAQLRRQAYDARNAQEHKDEVSGTIVERFVALPEYAAAKTAMWYLDVRSEVRTRHRLADALTSGKTNRRAVLHRRRAGREQARAVASHQHGRAHRGQVEDSRTAPRALGRAWHGNRSA